MSKIPKGGGGYPLTSLTTLRTRCSTKKTLTISPPSDSTIKTKPLKGTEGEQH
jgi:hypothetical protein